MENRLSPCVFLWIFLIICENAFCSHSLRHHGTHHVPSDTEDDGSKDRSSIENTVSTSFITPVFTSSTRSPLFLLSKSLKTYKNNEITSTSPARNITSINTIPSKGISSQLSSYIERIVTPGKELVLPCEISTNNYISTVQATSPNKVQWVHNGEVVRLTKNHRFNIISVSESPLIHLKIISVTSEDMGVWQCQERGTNNVATTKPVWVIVVAELHHPYIKMEDHPVPMGSRVTVKENTGAILTCLFKYGNPPLRVEWFIKTSSASTNDSDSTVNVFTEMNVTSTSHTISEYIEEDRVYKTKSDLILDNLSRENNNQHVICVVHQESQDVSQNASIQLNVQYSPSFVISRIPGFGFPVREGISLALKCDVDANPVSKPIWLKDNDIVPVNIGEDGFLNFTQLNRFNSGWYKCITHHILGNFSSIGYYLSVRSEIIVQPPQQVRVDFGGAVHLRCDMPGRQLPAVCWDRVGNEGRLEPIGSERELALERVIYQEGETYRCVARNQVTIEERKTETSTAPVPITGHPVVLPVNETLLSIVGKPSSMSMKFCANPVPNQIFWLIKSMVLRPGDSKGRVIAHNLTKSQTPECYTARLTILDLHKEDEGEYLFFIKNSKGIHEGTVMLNITHQASFSVSNHASILTGTILIFMLQVIVFVQRF